jgi:flagellar biosynthesis/type III secretory pathway chaperone
VSELDAAATSLARVLADEGQLYESLLALAGREQRAIVDGDVAELTRLLDEKESLVEHHHALETERMTALVAVAAATGSGDAELLTLTEVAAALPVEHGSAITEAGVWLRAQALALREATESNALLLHQSRDIVDRWLQYLRLLVGGRLGYTAEGAPGEASGPRTLDRTA